MIRFFSVAVLTIFSFSCSSMAAQKKQPNILFIAVDDLRPELGCYGAQHVISPNIDKLAASGMQFENHFVAVPTCGASRAALLTGRRPSESGGLSNHALTGGKSALKKTMQPNAAQTFPEMFRRSGYHTVCIGKISHQPDGKVFSYNGKGKGDPELPAAWDELATPYGQWKYGHGCFFAYGNGRHREDKSGYRPVMEFPDVADKQLPDGMMAEAAIKKLEEFKKQDKPFLLALGFFKPHLPFVAPKKYRDLYNDVELPLAPQQTRGKTAYWYGSGEFYKYQMTFPKTKPLAAKDQQASKKAYYACISYVDAQIGLVLNKLKELKLEEDTIVVLWGDHGWNLGDHAMWGKHCALEKSLRSPLIIRVPGMKSGKTQAVVETIDIYPTLMQLCKPSFNKSFYKLGGAGLLPVLQNASHLGKDAAISYWGRSRSVRSGQYRLIATRSKKGVWEKIELYDHKRDSHEQNNIAVQKPELTQRLLSLLKKDAPKLILR